MALTYSASFSGTSYAGVSVSAVQDLFLVAPSAAVPVQLMRVSFSTSGQTSPGNLIVSIQRYTATVTNGSGGSTPSIYEVAQYSTRAASSTVLANCTTRTSTTGSKTLLWVGTIQDLNNLDDILIPELRYQINPTQALVIGLEVAPSATTLYGTILFNELV